MFAVPAAKGKLEKIIKSSIYLPFPLKRVHLRRLSNLRLSAVSAGKGRIGKLIPKE